MFGLFDPRTLDASARTIQFVQADNGRRHRLTIASSSIAKGVAKALALQFRDGMTAVVTGSNGKDVSEVGLTIFEGVLNSKGGGGATMNIHGVRIDGKSKRRSIKDVPVVLRDGSTLPPGRLAASISGYLSPGGIRVSRLIAEPVISPHPSNAMNPA